jgi:hypothetical protein
MAKIDSQRLDQLFACRHNLAGCCAAALDECPFRQVAELPLPQMGISPVYRKILNNLQLIARISRSPAINDGDGGVLPHIDA